MKSPAHDQDTRSKTKKFSDYLSIIIVVIAVVFSLFHIYAGSIGLVTDLYRNVMHLSLILALIYLRSIINQDRSIKLKIVDLLFLGGSLFGSYYVLTNMGEIMTVRGAVPITTDIIVGAIFVICLLEALRRVTGLTLTILILFFVIYMRYGNIFPGFLAHNGFSWERIIFRAFLTNEGIWGSTLTVSSTYIALFVTFASILEKSGASDFFTQLANFISRGRKASAAWAAVIGSGLMGMISGSAAANVATTGSVTIPLMKRIGFSPSQAGGIEAAASTGGMLMPPVMGAAAFLIPSFLGISFLTVMKAAIIPALLFYFAVLLNVELVSGKLKFTPMELEKINIKKLLKDSVLFLVPLITLVALLILGRSPSFAAISSLAVLVVFLFISTRSFSRMKFLIDALASAAYSMIPIAIVCGAAGLIVQTVTSTGIGSVLSYNFKLYTGGNLAVMLITLAVISIILSMGMPATALYIVLVSTLGPALTELGLIPLAVHLFIFWYGCISGITPPVAITSYTAAGISGANIWSLSKEAFRFAIVGYLAPFIFVFSPEILLMGSSYVDVFLRIVFSLIGLLGISIALQGWFINRVGLALRVLFLAGGLFLLVPTRLFDYMGVVVMIIALAFQLILNKRSESSKDIKIAGY